MFLQKAEFDPDNRLNRRIFLKLVDVFCLSQIIKTSVFGADELLMLKIVHGRKHKHSLYRRPTIEQLYTDLSKLHELVTTVRVSCADPAVRTIAALLEDDLIDLLAECASHAEPNPWWNGRAEFDSFLLRVETLVEEVQQLERYGPQRRESSGEEPNLSL